MAQLKLKQCANCGKFSAPFLFVNVLIIVALVNESYSQEASTSSESIENEDDPGDPWETPMQELQRKAYSCSLQLPGFFETMAVAEVNFKNCSNSVIPKSSEVEVEARSLSSEPGQNSGNTQGSENIVYLRICHNTTAYKECWQPVIDILESCEPGCGSISGKLYFALYDDICREGGRSTLEIRKQAALQGDHCERNYDTDKCRLSLQLQNTTDMCLRFQSKVACDLSSIEPNCQNLVDKQMNVDVFARVGEVLGCAVASSSASASAPTMTDLLAESQRFAKILLFAFYAYVVFSSFKLLLHSFSTLTEQRLLVIRAIVNGND